MSLTAQQELEIVSLAVHFLKRNKPEVCRSYTDLSEEPLFKGVIHGLRDKYGITSDQLERHVCQQLHLPRPEQSRPDSPHLLSGRPRFDEFIYPRKFKPAEIELLPPESQVKAWRFWVAQQLGSLEGRSAEFDRIHGNSTAIANDRLRKEALRARADRKDSPRLLNRATM